MPAPRRAAMMPGTCPRQRLRERRKYMYHSHAPLTVFSARSRVPQVSKLPVHDQRHLMYVEKTFIPPKVPVGEKPTEGTSSIDLPKDQVYKLAVKAMQKRLERGQGLPMAAH